MFIDIGVPGVLEGWEHRILSRPYVPHLLTLHRHLLPLAADPRHRVLSRGKTLSLPRPSSMRVEKVKLDQNSVDGRIENPTTSR